MRALARAVSHVFDLIYPPACLVCSRNEIAESCRFLCVPCLAGIATAERPLPQPAEEIDGQQGYDADLAAWNYEGAIRFIIPAMKYRNARPSLARAFGEMAADRLYDAVENMLANFFSENKTPALTPVPLHALRQRERGFNQSLLLARAIGRRWGIEVLPHALRRIRMTRTQAKLSAEERARNVNGAFAPAKKIAVGGRTIFVVDDVITTGATMAACARELKQMGASKVIALALARAGLYSNK